MLVPRLIGLAALAIGIAGCAELRNDLRLGFAETARIERGKAHFHSVCVACHGEGSQPSPNRIAPRVEMIAQRYSPQGLARELEAIADVGHYGMPTVRTTPAERRDLVAFISSLQSPSAAGR